MSAGGAARGPEPGPSGAERPTRGGTPLTPADGGLALLLALGLALIYRATRQRWLWNDGFGLGPLLEWNPDGSWPHPLYLPVVRALGRLLGETWPYGALQAASWLPGALAGAGLYLWLRRTEQRAVAAAWSLVWALAPLCWFFATTIEVHALHAAAVALCAPLCLALPWSRPALALPLAALTFLPVGASHLTAVLLLPGWWALCRLGAARQRPLAPLEAWLLLPGLLAGAWLLTLLGSASSHWGGGLGHTVLRILEQIQRDTRGPSLAWLQADLAAPLGYLTWIPILCGALWLLRRGPSAEALMAALWLLPTLAFTALWAVPNAGGYLLGLLLPLGQLAAQGGAALLANPRRRLLLPLMLLPCVAWFGWRDNRAWTALYRAEARPERARAIAAQGPAAGLLLSFDPRRQPIGLDLPGVREFNAAPRCEAALASGRDPLDLARELRADLERLWPGFPGRILVDARLLRAPGLDPALQSLAAAIEAELRAGFTLEPAEGGPWPLLRLSARLARGEGS